MIGGTDITIRTRGGHTALDICLLVIRQAWSEAVFENALTGEKFTRYEDLPIGCLTELFVYRDPGAAREWEEKGADSSLRNTMIHLLLSQQALTIVVDDAAEQRMKEVVVSIQDAVRSAEMTGRSAA